MKTFWKASNKASVLLVISLFLSLSFPVFLLEVPAINKEFCHDEAGLLTSEQVQEIEAFLKNLNEISKVQLGFLAIPTLEDEVIEEYSMKVVQEWKLGDAKANSGALLLIARNERKVRIEAGYGLEGVLTDAVSALIIRNVIGPAFKQNNYYKGIKEGLQAIQGYALQDETLIAKLEGKTNKKEAGKHANKGTPWQTIFTVFGVFALIVFVLIKNSKSSLKGARRTSNRRGEHSTASDMTSFGGAVLSALSNLSTLANMLDKDDSSDDGPLGKGGSFGGGGATGGW